MFFNFCRYRMSEISFVLKAIATLIVSLKKTPDKGNSSTVYLTYTLYGGTDQLNIGFKSIEV